MRFEDLLPPLDSPKSPKIKPRNPYHSLDINFYYHPEPTRSPEEIKKATDELTKKSDADIWYELELRSLKGEYYSSQMSREYFDERVKILQKMRSKYPKIFD